MINHCCFHIFSLSDSTAKYNVKAVHGMLSLPLGHKEVEGFYLCISSDMTDVFCLFQAVPHLDASPPLHPVVSLSPGLPPHELLLCCETGC